jgi:hypothetical protein
MNKPILYKAPLANSSTVTGMEQQGIGKLGHQLRYSYHCMLLMVIAHVPLAKATEYGLQEVGAGALNRSRRCHMSNASIQPATSDTFMHAP